MKRTCWIWGLVVVAALLAADTLAGKGGGKKPPPDDPPADPAIAYTEHDGDGVSHLGVMNADGSNTDIILSADSIYAPTWSPEGTQLTFSSDINGSGIYVINVDGTGLRRVVATEYPNTKAAWSSTTLADGRQWIAFSDRNAGTYYDLFLVALDGTGLVNLTNTPAQTETHPTWSPDGTRLAIMQRDGDGTPEIVICEIGFTNGVPGIVSDLWLTEDSDVPGGLLNDRGISSPEWAKTSDRIAVHAPPSTTEASPTDIWVYDLTDPANPVNITNTSGSEEYPFTWSPDDTQIACWSGDLRKGGRAQFRNVGLYLLDVADGSKTKISDTAGQADWRRDP